MTGLVQTFVFLDLKVFDDVVLKSVTQFVQQKLRLLEIPD